VQVGFEEVVAGPVLRPVHDHVGAIDAQGLLAVGGVLLDHFAAAERILVFERGDQLDRRAADDRLLDLQQRTAGVALLPGGQVAVRTLRAADGVGRQLAGRGDGRFFRPQHGLVRQRYVVADPDQRHVVDPQVAGGEHPERRPGLFLFLDVRHVGQFRPAERAVLVQLHVLAVEHELGRRVPDPRADVQAAEVGRDLVASRFQIPQLDRADLGSGPADQQARMLARACHPADGETAIALVFPAAPLGEHQPELVPLLGHLERRIFDQVRAWRPRRIRRQAQEPQPTHAASQRNTHRLFALRQQLRQLPFQFHHASFQAGSRHHWFFPAETIVASPCSSAAQFHKLYVDRTAVNDPVWDTCFVNGANLPPYDCGRNAHASAPTTCLLTSNRRR